MRKLLLGLVLTSCSFVLNSQIAGTVFLEKPYLQLGDSPKLEKKESLELLWHTVDAPAAFTVEVRGKGESAWHTMASPATTPVHAPDIPPHLVYRVKLTDLQPGEDFEYRVKKEGQEVFTATGKARKSASQPYTFALFGDCAQDSPGQRAIAFQAFKVNPDFLLITGDIVYTAGRISEYRKKFFPVYAADTASLQTGAPLLQSIPFIAAPGNHDTALANFARFPDALAYFLYWDQPLNGPNVKGNKTSHTLQGSPDAQPLFKSAAKPRYPVMANFSFDYGNAHWTVLDSNPYMDWTNAELQAWVQKDLASASGAAWRFVAFHHPGFNSSPSHFSDQWMRHLSPIFEQGKVDVVFAGHVHNYQRTLPLAFVPTSVTGPKGDVDGKFAFDNQFKDGANAAPKGVIYIVSGGGGASLYNSELQGQPDKWQPFTEKYVADQNSFSVVSVRDRNFHFRQLGPDGKQLDSFAISK